MRVQKKEYSKVITTVVVSVFSTLAVGFVAFVCYEMHRMVGLGVTDALAPVEYLAGPIVGIPAAVVAFYMWRAKAKSKTDIEWEKTKQLTLFREKHPESFTAGTVDGIDDVTGVM